MHFDGVFFNSSRSEDMTDPYPINIVFEENDKQFLKDSRLFFPQQFPDFPTFDIIFEVDVEAAKPLIKLKWCILTPTPNEHPLDGGVEGLEFDEVFQEDSEEIGGYISSFLLG